MNILVTHPTRFCLATDGTLWTKNPSYGYFYWARHLDVFDEVRLCVRTSSCPSPPDGWNIASGEGITPVSIPDFQGPRGFLQNYFPVKHAIATALEGSEAILLSAFCTVLSEEVWNLIPRTRPYGVNLIVDPYFSFAPNAFKHPLRPFFRWMASRSVRNQCAHASAVLYVTQKMLQQRYPCPGFTIGASNIDLKEEAICAEPRPLRKNSSDPLVLILVGSLAQLQKAPDILIDAVAQNVHEGLNLQLVIVGEGKHRAELEEQSRRVGLAERVRFTGQLTNSAVVRKELDKADLFVLPSRAEGLPRAMIEAMARALPCIGSSVAGIPELLPPEDIVPPNDTEALAQKIREVATDPQRMARMSERNLNVSKEYAYDVLRQRRIAFYTHLKEQTARWLEQEHTS